MTATEDPLSQITPRQLEILNLVAKGLRNQEVAELLGISLSTVKVHIAAILKTLGVANRTEAVYEYQAALRDREAAMHSLATVARDVGRPAIAVLPFEDRSRAEEGEMLVSALHQDLVRRMSNWRWFPVLSTSATRDLESARADFVRLREVHRAVYAVIGQIHVHGERHRIHVDLVEAATEQVLWSMRQDFAGREVFDLLDELCRAVVARIAPELLRVDSERARISEAPGFDAWRLASQAMWHVMRATAADTETALASLEEAIGVDPRLTLAWYAKAAAHYQKVFHQWSGSPGEDLAAFRDAAARCLELDPMDSSAQEIFGFARLVEGRHDDAVHHLERAIELNPSNAQAYSELGQALALSGRPDEGIAHLEESLRLAPTGDSAWSTAGGIAIAHLIAGRAAEAEHWGRRAVSLDPDAAATIAALSAAQAAAGDHDAAKRTLDDLSRVAPDFDLRTMIQAARSAAPLYADALESAFREAGIIA